MSTSKLLAAVALCLWVPSCAEGPGDNAAQTGTPTPSPTDATVSPTGATSSPTDPNASPTSGDGRQRTPPPSSSGQEIQWTSCMHPEGISVDYPEGWHVNTGETLPPCSAFDPRPLNVPDAQEYFRAAVLLSVEQVDFSLATDPESQSGTVLDRRQIIVDGQDAVRIETRAEGEGLLAEGTRSTRWFIVLGREKTLSMSTHEVGDAKAYERHQKVLDQMVSRLQLPDPS